MRQAAFAIPGDINIITGGYIYEKRLLEELRALGHDVSHLQLGASFPDPTDADMADGIAQLQALDPARALILDGLVYGAIATEGLARVTAPIVAMIHHPLALETGLDPAQRDHLFKTERDNLALAQQVLVPSPHTAQILRDDYGVPGHKIIVARPGSRPVGVTPSPSDPPFILSVGLQHPRKGHDVLLKALAEVRDLPWRAAIVGSIHDTDYAGVLAAMLKDLGLSDQVDLMGATPRDALDELYANASIFALATWYEGYGMVFDEAMSWGLPIVSCAGGAVPDTVAEGAGLLVTPGHVGELADALSCVLTDAGRRGRMADASRNAGANLPSWQDTARVASGVLDSLDA
ncbi:glycosyltransferase family 4 protein [Jannaschia sp. CCS1]|uniref:glycosyltransferase family 4 protein n=1 Tax=Jannaschia sp. (strain CCS1) TaxID=290400 RepID=UPI000053C3FF|nr:glycosyltransferase family 4 protein [Jannaschia sp. CCS1]ABD53226.1 glycosyl transferase group 1 [Jannaschia sp. CCS1]